MTAAVRTVEKLARSVLHTLSNVHRYHLGPVEGCHNRRIAFFVILKTRLSGVEFDYILQYFLILGTWTTLKLILPTGIMDYGVRGLERDEQCIDSWVQQRWI
jgi:hypothetical protein